MQAHAEYGDVVGEVCQFLAHRIEACRAAGIVDIVVDPGIGFGKTTEHNLALLAALDRLGDLGRPVLVGVSRKRFIGELAQDAPPTERLGGTIAAGLAAVVHGASILRVHDVAAHVQALRVWHAIAAVQRT
jgi:dihydropteroate synthase